MTQLEQTQTELIDLLIGQLIDITAITKMELGDDVIAEIAKLTKMIDKLKSE